MSKSKRNYSKSTALFLVTHYVQIVLTIVYGVLLLPLYIKYISAEMYGYWLATGNMLMWFGLLMPDWSQLLLQQLGTADGAEDHDKFSKVLVSGIIIGSTFCFIFFTVSWACSFFFESWLNIPKGFDISTLLKAYLLAAAGTAMTTLGATFNSVNLAMHKIVSAGMANIIALLTKIILIIVLILNDYGLYALGYGTLIYGSMMLILNFSIARYNLKEYKLTYRFDLEELITQFKLTFYTSINKFGNTFMKQLDYFLVSRYLGGEATTMLRLVKVVPETLFLFATNTSYTLMPAISHSKGAGTLKSKTKRLMEFTGFMFAFSCFLGGVVYTLGESFIGLWFKENLFAGQLILILVIIRVFFTGIADTYGRYIFTLGNIKLISIIRFFISLIHILLLYIGVVFWKMPGMLIMSIVILVLSTILFKVLFVRLEDIPRKIYFIPIREFIIAALIAGVIGVFCHNLNQDSWLNLVKVGIIYSIIYAIMLFILSANTRMLLKEGYNILSRKFLHRA